MFFVLRFLSSQLINESFVQNLTLTHPPTHHPIQQCREKKGKVCPVINIPISVSAHKCAILAAGRAVEDEQDTAEARNLCTSNSNAQAGYADQGPTDEGEGKTSTTFDIVDAAGKDRYAGSRWTFQVGAGCWVLGGVVVGRGCWGLFCWEGVVGV